MKSSIRDGAVWLTLALIALPALAFAQRAQMPGDLTGVWSDNNEHGKTQCTAWRKNPRERADGYDPLVGAVIIRKGLIHSYSEYGEGNFYKVTQVTPAGSQRWRVRSQLYIDTMPSDDPPAPGEEAPLQVTDTMTLKAGTLTWESDDGDPRILFRCGDAAR